jgi:hypothetical protein
LLAAIATLDTILQAHATALGRDFTAYRNHAYRVANFCLALAPDRAMQIEKVAIAAAFHDLGIWTAGPLRVTAPVRCGCLLAMARRRLSQATSRARAEARANVSHKSTAHGEAVSDSTRARRPAGA